eukprot:gene6757-9259_t
MLIKPGRLFFRLSVDLSPFMHEIPRHFGAHEAFLKALDVKEQPSRMDYIQFLSDLAVESSFHPLNPNELRAVVTILSSIANESNSSQSHHESSPMKINELYLPDEDSIMRSSRVSLWNDNIWLRNRIANGLVKTGYHIIHPNVEKSSIAQLGVSLMSQVFVEHLNRSESALTSIPEETDLQLKYKSTFESPLFLNSISSLLANSSVASFSSTHNSTTTKASMQSLSATHLQLKLGRLNIKFVHFLETYLQFKTSSNPTVLEVVNNKDESFQSITFLDNNNSNNDSINNSNGSCLFINFSCLSPPITIDSAVGIGLCQYLSLDPYNAATVAYLLSCNGLDDTNRVINALRIGSDVVASRESFRGVPGEPLLDFDTLAIELKPFRTFRSSEIIAYDDANVKLSNNNNDNNNKMEYLRFKYGKIVKVGLLDENSNGIRNLMIDVGPDRGILSFLSTDVYSFKSAREMGNESKGVNGNNSNKMSHSPTTGIIAAASTVANSNQNNSISNTSNSNNNINNNTNNNYISGGKMNNGRETVSHEDVIGALNGLLVRAGVPVSMDQQAMITRILELEASNKRIQSELLTERSQLVTTKQSLEESIAAHKCPICITNNVSHVLVPCGHTFCEVCINQLQRNKCPNCRTTFQQKMKFFMNESLNG